MARVMVRSLRRWWQANWQPCDFECVALDSDRGSSVLLDAATMAPVENPDDLYKVRRTTAETGRAHSTLSCAALWSPTDWSPRFRCDPKQAKDKLILQNYGRPYNAAGKPQGTFYGHAKSPPLPEFLSS